MDFDTPLSRNEAILQNILGADNVLVAPQSRIEAILQAILNDSSYDADALSRMEELLLAIKNGTSWDKTPISRNEEILVAKLNGETYDKAPQSRIEELLIEWCNAPVWVEKTVSGSIVTITDAIAAAVIDLKVAVNATQSGSGTPSPDNVRPIVGVSEVNITQQVTDMPDRIYTINLGGTYYGGVLDVTNGVLTVTEKYGKLPAFNYKGAGVGVYLTPVINGLKQAVTGDKIITMCDKFLAVNTVPANLLPDYSISVTNNTKRAMVCILECDEMTVAQFNQYISDNVGDIYIVYELAEPFDIQLTPTQVDLAIRQNTIFADSGDVEVTYKAQP